MNEEIKFLKEYIFERGEHKKFRREAPAKFAELAEDFRAAGLSPQIRSAIALKEMLSAESPVILPREKLAFTRTIKTLPEIFTKSEWDEIKSRHFIHEKGEVFNISPDYETVLKCGLGSRRKIAEKGLEESSDPEARKFYTSVVVAIDAIVDLVLRYADEAESRGDMEMSKTLRAVSSGGANSFREALQLLRILHFSLWAAGSYHNTLGRIDQYLFPYYKKDVESGILSKDGAFDLLEEFFLSCNKDSDLYVGMQQGDNGQSVVLGGRSASGEYMFNELSEMALRASRELCLIDPKINIRVDSKTPLEIYEKGSELTKVGLGFPQYSNDDVVIPFLLDHGYSNEDAHEYVVAACWEFIIPKVALDIPNIDALALADCVRSRVKDLPTCATFEDFYSLVEDEIMSRCAEFPRKHADIYIKPSPLMSAMSPALENGGDISLGMKYNNYGIHGTGIATAADSLAAVKKFCFEEGSVSREEMARAVDSDFEGFGDLLKKLREEAPKMGQDDDFVDSLAVRLLDSFADALSPLRNGRGGNYRAGTGTAMYYVFHGKDEGATPDGRRAGEVIPANYSPSLFMKQKGPLSVIKSFTKPNLRRVANGGPLTLEFDQTVFRNEESVRKLAMLVRTFIVLGGHQLQLNAVNLETLLDAKAHPERHKHLIVRVWGWSGYFVELDECYQDHVIKRIEFGVQ